MRGLNHPIRALLQIVGVIQLPMHYCKGDDNQPFDLIMFPKLVEMFTSVASQQQELMNSSV